MAQIIYSNCIGTFVFSDKTLLEELLSEGNQNDAEAAMLKKYAGAKLIGKDVLPPPWILDFLHQK